MSISAERRKTLVKEYATNAKDTGSPEVQVAILTDRIKELSEHLKEHDHDYASRRGLNMMVARRTRLTEYLRDKDRSRYDKLISRLGLRK